MDTPQKETQPATYDEEGVRLKKRSDLIQKYLLRVRIGFRILDLIVAIISVISVGDTLVEYYSTQNTCTSSGNQCVWPSPANTMTYPSLITFGAAVINLILSAIVLIAYVWGTAKADDWEDTRGMFEKACSALKITISSAAAGSMYSTGTSTSPSLSQSLWRISCNGTLQADTVLAQFIDFNAYCLEQNLSASMHIVQIVSECLTGITYLLNYWADKVKKKLDTYQAAAPPPTPTATATSPVKGVYKQVEESSDK